MTACGSAPGASTTVATTATEPVPTGSDGAGLRSDSAAPADDGAVELLEAAVAATGDVYRFESVVAIGGVVTTTVTGAVAGDAQIATVETGDAALEYLKTVEGEWVRGPDDEEWVPVEEPVAVADPLGVLRNPSRVDVTADDGDTVKIRAVYSGAAIGAEADTVTLRITLRDGLVTRVRYELVIAGRSAEVDTTIGDVGNVEAIVGP